MDAQAEVGHTPRRDESWLSKCKTGLIQLFGYWSPRWFLSGLRSRLAQ